MYDGILTQRAARLLPAGRIFNRHKWMSASQTAPIIIAVTQARSHIRPRLPRSRTHGPDTQPSTHGNPSHIPVSGPARYNQQDAGCPQDRSRPFQTAEV